MKISMQSATEFGVNYSNYVRSIFIELIYDEDLSKVDLVKRINESVRKTLRPTEIILAAKFTFEHQKYSQSVYNKSIVSLSGDLFNLPILIGETSSFKDSICE